MGTVAQEIVGKHSRLIFDYVSICFHKHSLAEVISLLGFGALNFQGVNGAHGYKDRMYYDCVSIHYNGRDDMGVWLEMTGQGCRVFEAFGTGNYDLLFSMCENPNNEMNLTRLDVAFDDFDGLLDMRKLCDDLCYLDDSGIPRLKNVVTRFHEKSFKLIQGGEGCSITLGSKHSDVLTRIYDKDAEQGHEEGRHWIRVELQLRRERALGFVKAMKDSGSIGECFRGVLANYVRFVTETEDSNKRRWPTADYWEGFLMAANAISIYEKPSTDYKLSDLESYVIGQAGNAIEAYIRIRGIDGFLETLKNRGTMKNPKYEELINALKDPAPRSRELTPEELYANGLDSVYFRDFGNNLQIRDIYGNRWFKCVECGDIFRDDEMAWYGGKDGCNHGTCLKCIT